MSLDLNKIKKAHLVGIGGIGISALAKFFLHKGLSVDGSDLKSSFVVDDLRQHGAKVNIGHSPENLADGCDLLVYSAAVPKENPERLKAAQLDILQMSYPQALGELSRQHLRSISVSGNKGKTTTTAMLGEILAAGNYNPMAIVGSYVNNWGSNFLAGNSDYFVFEACEWKEHMNQTNPWSIVLTNLEPDHMDYYGTFENEIAAFQRYINKIPADGFYFYNADDPGLARLEKPNCRIVSYGIKNKADVVGQARKIGFGEQSFSIEHRGQDLGRFTVKSPGLFNIYNALAAAAVALEMGVSADAVRQALSLHQGTWRRFQSVGSFHGATIISDYAHHPTAIKSTISAAKEFYPGKKIIVAFEPHHHHRTKSLFNEFVGSFDGADALFISEIYQVAGRDQMTDSQVSSRDLVDAIKVRNSPDIGSIEYTPNLVELESRLKDAIQPSDLVLIMGAGDINRVAEQLVAAA